ncbi:hypothetical protein [Chondrinema litorale]|uniref:hypothetical protein n=1 Tax=Chondrinema litorale TaxID=2994555 RepID=UPI0025434245|nr:hypothetical protein [Chondrinema litorale]UZR96317.1 hypothetical protein OQ292_21910 [Chondrinema litorale]
MNERAWIAFLIFLVISVLNGYLPYKNGKKKQGILIGGFLAVLALVGLDSEFGVFFFPFFTLFTILFSIVHVPYWLFKMYGSEKIGRIVSSILLVGVIFLLLSPWIEDWMFTKSDAKNLLSGHGIYLNDDFELIENEAGGLRDYYHIFKLRVSENDYTRLVNDIQKSPNYLGFKDWREVYKILNTHIDTVQFENEYDYTKEIRSNTRLDDGTFHFVIKISKEDKTLEYIGSNE